MRRLNGKFHLRQRAAAGFSLTLKVAKHTDPPFRPFYARDPMAIKEVSERFRFDAHSLCRIPALANFRLIEG